MFLPFYITLIIHAIELIILLKRGELVEAYKNTKASYFILFFCALLAIVSLFYQNYLGILVTVGILMLGSFAVYYRQHISAESFEFFMDTTLILSLVAALVAIIQYFIILHRFNIDGFELIIFNTPKNRVDSFYFNANYYAMMIEFWVGIAFYKILRLTQEEHVNFKKIGGYCIIILINLFTLVLSGCRTAWPAMLAGLAIMLLFAHFYKLFGLIAAGGMASAGFLFTHKSYIPRASNITKYLGVRQKIWRAAIASIKDHPLFGEGPLTYMHIWKQYNGHNTQHAHNIFLDPPLSFGIVGILMILPYFISCIKRTYITYKLHKNDTLVALIIGLIVMTYIHGLLDYTIFFIQTSFTLFMVISSFDIYREEIDMYKK
ncbi:O-antigen ligase [Sharpea azabuensis]|uniref:O-antigen ligase family protein n=1 Tax=Sharpea azabuensis TaxID=322505 RepID=UPI0008E63685|nr:O-antigen ligase family protein [Sharpea azabuensis]MEE3308022.1 O-antigen ligase family protein [Sharpea azabuensis]SFD92479.1 O-antigen ligase [Sharpea azabuensis]SFK87149.1 O-antigen ligase [Sharpea azabuensis]